MATAIDISAVPLPPPWREALTLLVSRSVDSPGTHGTAVAAAGAVITALFGKDTPSFGQVARSGVAELKTACGLAGLGADALPVAKLREIVELLPLVRPETPICDECGNFPLSSSGGKVSTLTSGASCPFCVGGKLAVVPMRLRKLAWTDGRLVEPQVTHDLRAFPGTSIPLDDEAIVAWVGGYINAALKAALNDAGLPLYGWLAYMQLSQKAIPSYMEVADVLQDMRSAGLKDDAALRRSVAEAQEFLSAREVTNLPRRTRLPFIRGDIDALPRMTVAGRTYVIEGRVGTGDSCDVYRGAWDSPNTERVIIKVSRGGKEEAKRLAREVSALTMLASSKENGAPFMSRLLPMAVAAGSVPDGGALRAATVFRYKSGFDWTLADVLAEYPEGVDPRTMVWMMNRCLLLLRWLQMNKAVHAALVPEHVLIHPGYHAATFIGWTRTVRLDSRRSTVADPLGPKYAAYLPQEVAENEPVTFDTDVAMLSRCMIAVLGGEPGTGAMPKSVPDQIAAFLYGHARYPDSDSAPCFTAAESLEREFGRTASAVYGKRAFLPFFLPKPSR